MEQRDLLKDQIEELGRVLGKILANFLGLKNTGSVRKEISFANEQLNSKLDIDIAALVKLDRQAVRKYLFDRKLSSDHLDLLSQYLEKAAQHQTTEGNINYLNTALILLELANETANAFSFDRLARKEKMIKRKQQKSK